MFFIILFEIFVCLENFNIQTAFDANNVTGIAIQYLYIKVMLC